MGATGNVHVRMHAAVNVSKIVNFSHEIAFQKFSSYTQLIQLADFYHVAETECEISCTWARRDVHVRMHAAVNVSNVTV